MDEKIATNCYHDKHNFAIQREYDLGMLSNATIRSTLASNLDMLMRLRNPRWTQIELAKKSGVSQRTVSNMLSGNDSARSGATLDRVAAIADVFGLSSWHLLMPGLPHDIQHAKIMSDVLTDYIMADDGGKDLIHRVAEREGRYKKRANE